MVGFGTLLGRNALIDFEFPMSDLVAVIPYVLPLLFIGISLLLFQRHLPRTERRRNLTVLIVLLCIISSSLLVLYAGFGSYWWRQDGVTLGSWWTFVGMLQAFTDLVFGSVLGGVAYIALVTLFFVLVSLYVISPPNPDFVALRQDLKTAQDNASHFKSEAGKLESDNKRLTEFVSEKESSLKKLQDELDTLKGQVSEGAREKVKLEEELKAAAAGIDDDKEQELLDTISKKDQSIGTLQSKLDELQKALDSARAKPPAAGPPQAAHADVKLKEAEARLSEIRSRTETAVEVSDSMISELAQLMSLVESSRLEPSAKTALTGLIENLGKAVGRVSRPTGEKGRDEPRIEMIGAVMMIHEIVDGIRKIIRSPS